MPRFTLRDLFWLILAIALGLGWWIYRERMEERVKRLQTDMGRIYEVSLPGLTLEDAIQQHKMEQTRSWTSANRPPGDPTEITYFLPHGDLRLEVSGQPATILSAHFEPSDKSADERYQAVTAGWSEWVKGHSR